LSVFVISFTAAHLLTKELVMSTQLEVLLDKMKVLEDELIEELQKQQEEFSYEITKRRVYFEENVIIRHKEYTKQLFNYITDAKLKHILSTPFIWICIVPVALMDITISLYQAICFPIYGIPKVKRQDYIVFDRQYLNYFESYRKDQLCLLQLRQWLVWLFAGNSRAYRTILVPD